MHPRFANHEACRSANALHDAQALLQSGAGGRDSALVPVLPGRETLEWAGPLWGCKARPVVIGSANCGDGS